MGRALLFSGHMIDGPDRAHPRFPAWLEPQATSGIQAVLDSLRPTAQDIAISSAACGGDLIFLELCGAAAVPCRIYLPFEPNVFRKDSVDFANSDWGPRFEAALERSDVLVATQVLGPLPQSVDPYARVNEWMVQEAKRIAPGAIEPIFLWDGNEGDGPGGTDDMRTRSDQRCHHIDIARLRARSGVK